MTTTADQFTAALAAKLELPFDFDALAEASRAYILPMGATVEDVCDQIIADFTSPHPN